LYDVEEAEGIIVEIQEVSGRGGNRAVKHVQQIQEDFVKQEKST